MIGERLVDERPEVLGGLQLGTVRRLEDEPDAIRYLEVLRPMPAGVVELQDDALGPAPTDLAKSARMASNISLLMLFETFHTVWPVADWTKPVT